MSKEGTDVSSNLQVLITKRSSIRGQITKFKNYLSILDSKSVLNPLDLAELNLKLSRFETLSSKFDDLQSEIEVINSDELSIEIDVREDIEQLIITNVAFAQNILQKHKVESNKDLNSSHASAQCCSNHSDAALKMPEIKITKFDGTSFRWLDFRDTFLSLVHNNERISPINKYHYLTGYLEGEAQDVLANLEISDANYNVAWSMLCERYDNPQQLVKYHLDSLLDVGAFTRESDKSLRSLVNHTKKNLRALASLNQHTEHWDVLVIHIMLSKLDRRTLSRWEEYRKRLDKVPNLQQFYKFLLDRADVLESLNKGKSEVTGKPINQPVKFNRSQTKSFASTSQNDLKLNVIKCIICSGEHRIYNCPVFKAGSVEDKRAQVLKFNLCSNCLRQGHSTRDCRLGPCRECKKRHNTLLHMAVKPTDPNVVIHDKPQSSVSNYCKPEINSEVILSTAIIKVCNPRTNKSETVRALLDCGSQSSFITRSLQSKLSLPTCSIKKISVVGIGNHSHDQVMETCSAHLVSLQESFSTTLNCLVLDELTGELPKSHIDMNQYASLLKDFKLADPNFNQPSGIDILIGADVFWDILGCEQKSLGSKFPKLRSSQFGWLIAGPVYATSSQPSKIHSHHAITCRSDCYEIMNRQFEKFWEFEQLPQNIPLSISDKECESHFISHTTRLPSGRFCVKLPLKDSPDCLGESYSIAKRRLLALEKRFHKHPHIKTQYSDFLSEYKNLNHLSESSLLKPQSCYFLAHHAVFKDSSESTKIRVVFDGSSPTTSGFSVNDILLVGPNMQDSLFSILLRARQYKYVLTGDIEKMYRQVQVHADDQNLQLILWRNDECSPLKTLKLHTVTYGLACSSYLSTRCLWQLGEDCDDPHIKEIIQHDFYVDDLYTGCDSEQELVHIHKTVTETLKRGCFILRKFKSNLTSLVSSSKSEEADKLITSESSSTLGMGWNPRLDIMHFPCSFISKGEMVTKRHIMSSSLKIFDPMGLLSPCVILPKVLIQELWIQKLGWDEPVPQNILDSWNKFITSIPSIHAIQIPRRVLCDDAMIIELHSFSDASKSAYGACVYARSVDAHHNVTVRLLCAKSKVAPIKPTTIPRLELCAALLAARLCKAISESLSSKSFRFYHWCDSTTVLGWLQSSFRNLKMFVANRVAEICELTNANSWYHVPTSLNPADLISRGVYPDQIIDNNLWWFGPNFLLMPEAEKPIQKLEANLDLPEIKAHVAVIEFTPIMDFSRYSNFMKLKKICAWVLRFVTNAKGHSAKLLSTLTLDELNNAFLCLCSLSQRQSFSLEYDLLSKGKALSPKSNILSLTPFFDGDNKVIRVGGRLNASNFNYNQKHPVLLHASNKLTHLIFEYEHINNLHAGPQLLLAIVRETIWTVNGRYLARRTVNNCVTCRRHQGKTIQPIMGNLPAQRVTVDFPFNSIGVDFAGPFYIINRKGRGAKLIKCYLCLFICLRYKCVHLEATSDLTKDAFIMTFRRFIARRGKPSEVFCDNGRNFVAASKEFGDFIKLNQQSFSEFGNGNGIRFIFSPSYAPHFGGMWEAGVKSAKHHIKRVIGNSHLTFEELSTLFAQVEAILNSRPMCSLSPSPDDLSFLTPGHFLIGRPLVALPSPSLLDYNSNCLQRYARLEQLRQHFWQRWQREYVAELQQRTKWKTNASSLKPGALVLLREDHAPPLCWRLGRVVKLYPGPDNVARVAEVMTIKGCVRRPLVRLSPLPSIEELDC